jgi:hypothetical protein
MVESTWYSKETKVCDPSESNFISFTGFKISRIYKLTGLLKPQNMCFLSFSHCNHGKIDYSIVERTASSSDIDWNTLFCVLKPYGDFGVKKTESEGMKEDATLAQKISSAQNGIKELLRNAVDKGAEILSDGTYFEYTGKRKTKHLEDVTKSDPQASLEWESRNLKCFKMARRKKYAKRSVSFYMPLTFVGGLFECHLSDSQRREFFKKFAIGDFVKPFKFDCDKALAVPILPLIADDSTKNWFQTGVEGFHPFIIHTIPYLSTAGPLNLRFSSSDTPDMFRDTWASKIDVNEDYSYTEIDLHLISQAAALTTDYLNKIIAPLDLDPILKALHFETPKHDPLESPVREFDTLSIDQRIYMLLSRLHASISRKHLLKIQHIWDNNID